MSTLDQLREGLSRIWDTVAEGWYDLREKAAHALTRFHPSPSQGELATSQKQLIQNAARWSLLAAEVREDENEVVVKLEVPGMDPENFDIQVVDDYLVVQGEKQVEREQKTGRYYVMERAYGRFERAIPLPTEVDESQARAKYQRGVLLITLPKSPKAHGRRIEIQAN
jgi:HSP20 family protein